MASPCIKPAIFQLVSQAAATLHNPDAAYLFVFVSVSNSALLCTVFEL